MSHPHTLIRPVVVATLALTVVLLASCANPWVTPEVQHHATTGAAERTGQAFPEKVDVYGDSLALQAEPYFKEMLSARDARNVTYYSSYGGTAICDWLPAMRSVAARTRPQAVVLEFSGNAMTHCMSGLRYYTPAYYAKYRADTMEALAIWLPTGAHIYLIGAPVTRAQQARLPTWDALNLQYAQIATSDPENVTYVDAGRAVEGRNGTYTRTLACLAGEPCTGPVVRGIPSNVVRSADGVHFCPTATGGVSCPVYSSGAFRFAAAMVQALATPVTMNSTQS